MLGVGGARVATGSLPVPDLIADLLYREDGPPVLDGITFTVPARGLLAIVGPSGAGKTTLFSLLERFYDPVEGAIAFAGRDLRAWPRGELRAAIAYVEQDAPVLAGTLRANLLYAAPDAAEEALWTALATTRLERLVARLPEGLETEVGARGTAPCRGRAPAHRDRTASWWRATRCTASWRPRSSPCDRPMSSVPGVVSPGMTQLLTGKTAIIYGAGGSLGGGVARTFARERATVHLAGRTREPLDRVAADIAAPGLHTAAVQGTLTHEVGEVNPDAPAQLEAMMEQLTQMTMLRRRPEVEQIAETAAFLASDRAGAITSGIVNATCGLVAG